MPISTLTSKGQITVPKAVRDHLDLTTGDRVDFVINTDGRVEVRPLGRPVTDLCGFLKREGRPPVSPDEMDESILLHLSSDDDRIRRGE